MLAIGDKVVVEWTWGGSRFKAPGVVTKVSGKTVKVRLTEHAGEHFAPGFIVTTQAQNVRKDSNMQTTKQRSVRAPRMDEFTQQYFETALWSSNDNSDDSGGEPLDANHSISDIDPETRDRMIEDCADFQKDFGHLIDEGGGDYGQAGHDFWLTRNGHGAGFWDGDWPEPQAEALTEASKDFGEYNLYVGDDGVIYGDTSGGYRYNPGYDPSTRKAPSTAREHRVAAKGWDGSDANDRAYHSVHNGLVNIIVDGPTERSPAILEKAKRVLADLNRQTPPKRAQISHDAQINQLRRMIHAAEEVISGRRAPTGTGSGRGPALRAPRHVRDYEAIDRQDRVIAGPFKSYGDAKDAAGSAGAVRFVPSRGKPSKATEARETRSAHNPSPTRRQARKR